jgi:hypothetical protein
MAKNASGGETQEEYSGNLKNEIHALEVLVEVKYRN